MAPWQPDNGCSEPLRQTGPHPGPTRESRHRDQPPARRGAGARRAVARRLGGGRVFLGIDVGTSSLKALVLDVDGTIVGSGQSSYPMAQPRPGWAEADPQDWWKAAAPAVAGAAGPHAAEIAAVGLSGQMHGVVLCDDTAEVIRPAILWADGRSTRELEAYSELSSSLRRSLGNPPATGMAGPTLLWLRNHERQHYRRAQWALQPKDWLRLRLVDEAATDPSDASGTLLYDLEAEYWAKDVIEALDLRLDFLAPIRESAEICGILERDAAAHLGVRPNLPVVCGAADTAAAALAGGVLDPSGFGGPARHRRAGQPAAARRGRILRSTMAPAPRRRLRATPLRHADHGGVCPRCRAPGRCRFRCLARRPASGVANCAANSGCRPRRRGARLRRGIWAISPALPAAQRGPTLSYRPDFFANRRSASSRVTERIVSMSRSVVRQLEMAGRNATLPAYSVVPK